MTTPSDICLQALKISGVLGVGQQAQAEDINDAYHYLQGMLAQYQRKRWMIWHLVDVSKVSTGAQSYTVAAGGNFNVARPDRLEGAYVRQVTSASPTGYVDTTLDILESRQDYSAIKLKRLTSIPFCIFYDPAYPTGVVYPWPAPTATIYEIHLLLKEQLGALTSLAQTLILPPEYIPMLEWNLAIRLRVAYQMAPNPALNYLAKDSLNLIKNSNTQVPLLKMPRGLSGSGAYNIFSDN